MCISLSNYCYSYIMTEETKIQRAWEWYPRSHSSLASTRLYKTLGKWEKNYSFQIPAGWLLAGFLLHTPSGLVSLPKTNITQFSLTAYTFGTLAMLPFFLPMKKIMRSIYNHVGTWAGAKLSLYLDLQTEANVLTKWWWLWRAKSNFVVSSRVLIKDKN